VMSSLSIGRGLVRAIIAIGKQSERPENRQPSREGVY
jgi:hypothetical protein